MLHKTQIQSLFQILTLHPSSLVILQTRLHQIIFLLAMVGSHRRYRRHTGLEGIHLFLLLRWVESRRGGESVGFKCGIATNVDARSQSVKFVTVEYFSLHPLFRFGRMIAFVVSVCVVCVMLCVS